MPVDLFKSSRHRCIAFNDLVRGEDGVQANQFLVLHDEYSALIDPGGALLYTPVSLAVGRYVPLKSLSLILASHQDPDVIGSVDRWLVYTGAKVVCSKWWGRFVPHSVPHYLDVGDDRYVLLGDEGADLPFADSILACLPAHFLHSVGNFNVFDPVSKILFSGDVGASLYEGNDYKPVEDFAEHLKIMAGFHRRFMASNRACRIWVQMVRELDIETIVPQHGLPFVGKDMINQFLGWLEGLECGTDLMVGPGRFRTESPVLRAVVPRARIAS